MENNNNIPSYTPSVEPENLTAPEQPKSEKIEPVTRSEKRKKPKKPHAKLKKTLVILLSIYFFYLINIAYNIPGLATARNLWIETAMTTQSHQWLATAFFPKWLIDGVMGSEKDHIDYSSSATMTDTGTDVNMIADITGGAKVGQNDVHGNKILTINKKQGILIVQIKTSTYQGKLMFIDNPARVHITTTDYKGVTGERIADLVKKSNAIAGINANAYVDPVTYDTGAEIIGKTIASGKSWGTFRKNRDSGGFLKSNNKLVVGKISSSSLDKYRDFMQWGPALVVDGKPTTSEIGGLGIQPRSGFGQRKTGSIILGIIDGRQPGYSIGISITSFADIFAEYDALNAIQCDGGSSAILYYKNQTISKPSAKAGAIGRLLPNAVVVDKKS